MQKIPNKYQQLEANKVWKEVYTTTEWGLFQVHSWFNIWKKVSVMHHINRLKKKSHVTISVNTEKVFDKVCDKMVSKLGMDGNLLHSIKNTNGSLQVAADLVGKTCCHPAKTRSEASKPRCPRPSHHTGCPSQAVRWEKEINSIQTGEEDTYNYRWHVQRRHAIYRKWKISLTASS